MKVNDFFDGRKVMDKSVDWTTIEVGDVVLEGNDDSLTYRTLTAVDDTYWEYFGKDGYFHATHPEYCHYLVRGNKHGGELVKINYDYTR